MDVEKVVRLSLSGVVEEPSDGGDQTEDNEDDEEEEEDCDGEGR